jgi:hypothetical protein
MASERTFLQQLISHVGGLVRVRMGAWVPLQAPTREFDGKIGLLMKVFPAAKRFGARRVELLIDGRIVKQNFYPEELEFLGADDV